MQKNEAGWVLFTNHIRNADIILIIQDASRVHVTISNYIFLWMFADNHYVFLKSLGDNDIMMCERKTEEGFKFDTALEIINREYKRIGYRVIYG